MLGVLSTRKHSPQSGFTLTEMLVVVGIFVLVTGLTTVGMKGFLEAPLEKTAVSQVHTALELARAEAILRAQPVGVAFSNGKVTEYKFKKYAIFLMDYVKEEEEEQGGPEVTKTSPFEMQEALSEWKVLPEGILFVGSKNETFIGGEERVKVPYPIDRGGSTWVNLPCLIFGADGSVIFPYDEQAIKIKVAHGYVEDGEMHFTSKNREGKANQAVIRVGRLTGRARIE